MPASGQHRQADCHRSANVEKRESIQHSVGFVIAEHLAKAECSVDLVAMGQGNQLWLPRGAAGMKQRADIVAPRRDRKVGRIGSRGIKQRPEWNEPFGERHHIPDHDDMAQCGDGGKDALGLVPAHRVKVLGGNDKDRRPLGNQQVSDRVTAEKIVDRAGDAGHLRAQQ